MRERASQRQDPTGPQKPASKAPRYGHGPEKHVLSLSSGVGPSMLSEALCKDAVGAGRTSKLLEVLCRASYQLTDFDIVTRLGDGSFSQVVQVSFF